MLLTYRVFPLFFLFFLTVVFLMEGEGKAAEIETQLSFSVDGGKTFSAEMPVLPPGHDLQVRADWEIHGETRPIAQNLIFLSVRNETEDFASANQGRQDWRGKPAWFQQDDSHLHIVNQDRTAILTMQFGSRPEGTMGYSNSWDKTLGRTVNVPLPAAAPLSVGIHSFIAGVYYREVGDSATGDAAIVRKEIPFEVKIDPTAVVKTPMASLSTGDEMPFPTLAGDKVWPVETWKLLGGGEALQATPPLVRPAVGQEIGFRLDGLSPGNYYLRVLVDAGRGHGENELNSSGPFLFVNGRPIQFSRGSPLSFHGGTWMTVIESADPIPLQPGDEIRWNSNRKGESEGVGGVAVAIHPLSPAPIDVSLFYDPDLHDVFRLDGKLIVGNGSSESDNLGIDIGNVSGTKGDFKVEVDIRDFWQRTLASKTVSVSIENRMPWHLDVPFPSPKSDHCRAIVKVSGPGGATRERVFEQLLDGPRGVRPRLWLNQGWDWTSLADDGTAATRTLGGLEDEAKISASAWKSVDLPAAWTDTNPKDHLAWYRRQIEFPTWLSDKQLILHFSRVSYEGRFFLNGEELGSHFGQTGPFEFNVTGKLHPGMNELLLEVRDGIAALDPSELNAPHLEISALSKYRAPSALKAGVGEIWIDGMGTTPIGDVFVKSSFRKKEVSLEVEIPSLPVGTTAVLKNHVFFEGKEVLAFPDKPVSGAGTIRITAPWADPVLWNPGVPNLLQLVTDLQGTDGKILDQKETRFGFREFWAEGTHLVWNGTPMKFAGIPFLYGWDWELTRRCKRNALRESVLLMKRMGGLMQRHIYDPESHAEIADEEGIVMAQGEGGVATPTLQIAGSDEFWKETTLSAEEMVHGMRNHPSIVEWYLSNEFSAANEEVNQKRLQALGQAVLKVDDSRIIEFGCDLDVGGESSVISTHYPVDVRALRDDKALLPDAVYWRPLNTLFRPGDHVPDGIIRNVANVRRESPIVWGEKPIIINETLWDYFLNPPDGLSRLTGELPYRSPTALEQSIQEAITWFVRGDRDAEASVITPWEWIDRDTINLSLPQVDINPIQRYEALFGGTHVDFDVNLHWDVPRAGAIDWKWELVRKGDGGHLAGSATAGLSFTSGEIKRERLSLDLPVVSGRTECSLILELQEGKKIWRRVDLPLTIYPKEKLSLPPGLRIGLYDPTGETRSALVTFFPGLEKVSVLNTAALQGISLLILGNNAAVQDDATGRQALQQYAEQGGRILVLAQDQSPQLLPLPLTCTKLVSGRLWSFRPGNPLLDGMGDDALVFWYPDHVVARDLYLKPEGGGWKTWLESGGPNGLIYAAVLEGDLGRGKILCSQLAMTDKLEKNPAAALFLANELHYLIEPADVTRGLAFQGESDGQLKKVLDQMGARFDSSVSIAGMPEGKALLWDGDLPLSPDKIAELRDFATWGGRLWIHGITPANRTQIDELLGQHIALYGKLPSAWAGRAIKIATDPAISGLTDYDLFWKRRLYDTPETPFYDPSMVLDALGDWALQPDNGTILLYPGYLAMVPLGKGSVLLDNLHWERQGLTTRQNARRIASILLTNFGAKFSQERRLAIPEGLSYAPVDLSGVLNRAFADDVAEDGKGGWSDQGPDADMRNFPVEPAIQTFHGVPFHIGNPIGVLTLASSHAKEGPPESAELPVSGRADALFFLQSSAWTAPVQDASYVIHYADGSDYEIKLIGGVNLRDWADPNPAVPFPYETDTVTRVAWTGTTRVNPKASLYWMAWLNPRPEIPLRGISFRSTRQAVPMLVAITVGTKEGSPSAGQGQAHDDASLAKAELEAARAAVLKGDLAEARHHFQSAVHATPHSPDPYLEWASVEQSSKGSITAIPVYEALLREIPDHLETLFRLGKAYEDEKEWDKAGDIYRHSLELNPNQPEVLRALNALDQKKNP